MKKQNKAHINKWIKQLAFTQTLLGQGAFSQIACVPNVLILFWMVVESKKVWKEEPTHLLRCLLPDYTCIGCGLASKIVSKASAWFKSKDANAVALWTGRASSTWRQVCRAQQRQQRRGESTCSYALWLQRTSSQRRQGDASRVHRCWARSWTVASPWQMQTDDAVGGRPLHNADVLPSPELLGGPWTPRPRVEKGREEMGEQREMQVPPVSAVFYLTA